MVLNSQMQALKELVQMYENEIYKNLSKPGFFFFYDNS